MHPFLDAFLQALAAVAASYVVVILHKFLQKIHLNVTADQQAQLEAVAALAIRAVSEEAAAQAKAKLPKLQGADKLERAIDIVTSKLPGTPAHRVETVIHALLPKLGEGAQL